MTTAWQQGSADGGEFLFNEASQCVVELRNASIGWFRFKHPSDPRCRIVWTDGTVDYQDFQQCDMDALRGEENCPSLNC
eukprot:m.260600 g.260600  ORF g.260600 m.260600 type:complete len:79 (-) comp19218_c0_seq12:185-421(-)